MINDLRVRAVYQESLGKLYLEFLKENHKDPNTKEFSKFVEFSDVDAENGVTSWKDIFKNISEVRRYVLDRFPEEVEQYTFTEHDFGTADYYEKVSEEIKKYRKFVVSTAVNNKPVDIEFLASLKQYAKENNAKLLWVVSHDVKSTKRECKWNLDPALRCGIIVTDDLILNDNVMISGIVASAKQINPLTGLPKLCPREDKSIIFPGCKQVLQHIAEIEPRYRTPHKVVCMGAVTVPDYNEDRIMSGRTSYIAEKDHQMGALVVELEDEKRFHIRLVQAAEDGSFTDMGMIYSSDKPVAITTDAILVLGDLHVGGHGLNTLLFEDKLKFISTNPYITEVIVHDIENAASVSHHEENDFIKRIMRYKNGEDSLIEEGNDIVRCINALTELPNIKQVSIVNSNHDRHVEKWLSNFGFFRNRDTKNAEVGLELALALTKGTVTSAVQYLVENLTTEKLSHPEKIKWIGRDESYKRYGVELGRHGDEGKNGAKGSLRTYATCLYNAVIGHSHSAGVQQKVFQVGTGSNMDMGYNHGLSSWTNTDCLVYKDGGKQLIDFIPTKDGGYTYRV